jgi:hypothetical protein
MGVMHRLPGSHHHEVGQTPDLTNKINQAHPRRCRHARVTALTADLDEMRSAAQPAPEWAGRYRGLHRTR